MTNLSATRHHVPVSPVDNPRVFGLLALAPSPPADPVMQSPEVVAAIIGGAVALIGIAVGAVVGLLQWKKSQKFQRQLERERADYEDSLARERAKSDTERATAAAAEAEAEAERAMARRLALEADDRERAALAYRESLVRELKALRVLDMAKSLDLNALYVQVRIREGDSRRYLPDEEIERLAVGHPAALLAATAERTIAKHSDAVRPEDALAQHQHIVVLGDPGAGKTTMLKHLAFRMCREENSGLPALPVFVELRRFIDSGLSDILEFAVQECERRYGFFGAKAYLEERLEAGDAALLFDGLDEVLGGSDAEQAGDAYRKAAAEIERVCARYSKAAIAVTCRRAGFSGGLDRFVILEVLDFTWDQSRRFLQNWFAGREKAFRDLVNSLHRNVRMKTLAANPLILSLIAIVYERDLELPERRAELYKRCVEVLLMEWDSRRGIRRFARFTTDRKRDLLEELAWHFHVKGQRYFAEREVLDMIRDFLPTISLEHADPADILREIAANYGLLKEQANGWYGFWHLTIQEYFAAVWAAKQFPECRDLLLRHRHDPWWEEVILLLADRMSDATDLLLGIAGVTDRDAPLPAPLVADDDVLHRDLLLIGNCLLATPRITRAGLRAHIVKELWSVLTTTRSQQPVAQCARILALLDEPKQLNRLRQIALGAVRVAYPSSSSVVMGVLGECAAEPFLTQLIRDIIDAQNFDQMRLIQAANERGFSATKELVARALDSLPVEDLDNLSGSLLTMLLILCYEWDADLALRRTREMIGAFVEKIRDGSGSVVDVTASYGGSGCAYVAARAGARSLFEDVAMLAALPYASSSSGNYLYALLSLYPPGCETRAAQRIVAAGIKIHDDFNFDLPSLVNGPMHAALIQELLNADDPGSELIYDLLRVSKVPPESVRIGLQQRCSDRTEALLHALLAVAGSDRGVEMTHQILRGRMAAKELDFELMRRQTQALIDAGRGDVVLADMNKLLSGLDERDAEQFCDWLKILPEVERELVAEQAWVAFKKLEPALRRYGSRTYLGAVAEIVCGATASSIMAFGIPGEILTENVPANRELLRRLSRAVDSGNVAGYFEMWKRFHFPTSLATDENLATALLQSNYRLYADGRLEPAVK
ncbi:NACHT domain-containing protein [Actinoplanes sp. NPDC051861]|uniref:NACHT domain-containing protein n=1 Tax=Actinoplanes sp. NPDC051861 TaxID=3155170 RepID=UPI0034300B61